MARYASDDWEVSTWLLANMGDDDDQDQGDEIFDPYDEREIDNIFDNWGKP